MKKYIVLVLLIIGITGCGDDTQKSDACGISPDGSQLVSGTIMGNWFITSSQSASMTFQFDADSKTLEGEFSTTVDDQQATYTITGFVNTDGSISGDWKMVAADFSTKGGVITGATNGKRFCGEWQEKDSTISGTWNGNLK